MDNLFTLCYITYLLKIINDTNSYCASWVRDTVSFTLFIPKNFPFMEKLISTFLLRKWKQCHFYTDFLSFPIIAFKERRVYDTHTHYVGGKNWRERPNALYTVAVMHCTLVYPWWSGGIETVERLHNVLSRR
jgi:hypothetical protein